MAGMKTVNELEAEVRKALQQSKLINIACGGNLIISVRNGKAAYFASCSAGGKVIRKRLGAYGKMQLKTAREQAAAFKAQTLKEAETKERRAATYPKFGEAVTAWLETFKDLTRHKNLKRYETVRSEIRKFDFLNSKTLDKLRAAGIQDGLKAQHLTQASEYQSMKALNQFLEYEFLRDEIPADVFRKIELLAKSYKRGEVPGFSFVPAEELKAAFFEPLVNAQYRFKVFYLFVAFTALRRGSAINCLWDWIDREAGIITIPGEYMKMGKPFTVPITRQLAALLDNMAQLRGSAYLFPSILNPEKPMGENTAIEPIRSCCSGKMTIHGLRKSVCTWLYEQGTRSEIAEMCLAHMPKSQVVRAYLKTDWLEERREAMQQWADYLEGAQLTPAFLELIGGAK